VKNIGLLILQFTQQELFQYYRIIGEYHHHQEDYLQHPHLYPNINLIFIKCQHHLSSRQSNSSYPQYYLNLLIIEIASGFQLTELHFRNHSFYFQNHLVIQQEIF
jgi:hypothetical protein